MVISAAASLLSFWNDSRLHADRAKSASVKPAPGIVPWRDALEDVLKVGYGIQAQPRFVAGAWERVRWRTTPSAGALYPFEVVASVIGDGSYLWDVEAGRLHPCGLPPLTRDDLDAAGFVTRPGHRLEALLIFIARPWLSMRKYRQRGYAYCHLDVGHTATNLAIYTMALGHPLTLHLRFSRTFLAGHLKLEGLCREPFAVLSFASEAPAGDPAHALEEAAEGPFPIALEPPEQIEILNWESLRGIVSFDSALEPPCEPRCAPLLQEPQEPREPEETSGHSVLPLPEGRPAISAATEWRAAILGRRSAKGFRDRSLNVDQIGELLAALRGQGLAADCSAEDSGRVGVRLVARNVDGVEGVFAYSPREHALHLVDPQARDPRPACMQQGLAGDAAALLILHAPLFSLVERQGYSAFAELHFRAAELGQRLHLAAARLGDDVGVTCIGGFDGEECSALARLEPGEEALYVILLGIRDESAFKHDRLSVAFSHGYTNNLDG